MLWLMILIMALKDIDDDDDEYINNNYYTK